MKGFAPARNTFMLSPEVSRQCGTVPVPMAAHPFSPSGSPAGGDEGRVNPRSFWLGFCLSFAWNLPFAQLNLPSSPAF